MKLTRHTVIAFAVIATLALVGCGKSSGRSSSGTGSETPAEPAQAQPAEADYAVTIDAARVSKDMSGDPVVIITYTFTNNSDDKANFSFAINSEVYQNGIELDEAYLIDDVDTSASLTNIKPGASIQVEEAYSLNDMSDIEVEVSELLSFSNDLLATQTFTLE